MILDMNNFFIDRCSFLNNQKLMLSFPLKLKLKTSRTSTSKRQPKRLSSSRSQSKLISTSTFLLMSGMLSKSNDNLSSPSELKMIKHKHKDKIVMMKKMEKSLKKAKRKIRKMNKKLKSRSFHLLMRQKKSFLSKSKNSLSFLKLLRWKIKTCKLRFQRRKKS